VLGQPEQCRHTLTSNLLLLLFLLLLLLLLLRYSLYRPA
jgi:hypothetical protein